MSHEQPRSVIEALEADHFATDIAASIGRSPSHVHKVLRIYEADGVVRRRHGDRTKQEPDYWERIPQEAVS